MSELSLRVTTNDVEIKSQRQPLLLLLLTREQFQAVEEHREVQVQRVWGRTELVHILVPTLFVGHLEDFRLDLHQLVEALPPGSELFFSRHLKEIELVLK